MSAALRSFFALFGEVSMTQLFCCTTSLFTLSIFLKLEDSKEKVFKLLSSEKNPVIAEIKTFHNNAISHEA